MKFVTVRAEKPTAVILLAHGAGAGMNHPFMEGMAHALADNDFTVERFNFPYMDAGKKFPGSPKTNIRAWQDALDQVKKKYPDLPLFVAGKSYGGRMGSHLLAENNDLQVSGILYLGFPLHAPGKDSTDRATHLKKVRVPQLFLQGSRDKLANIDLIKEVINSLNDASLVEIEAADHSFKTPKAKGIKPDQMYSQLAGHIASWINPEDAH